MGAARCAATAVAEAAWYMVVEAATRERFDSRGGDRRCEGSEVAFAEELHEVAERAVDGVVPGAGEGVCVARAREDGLVRLVTRTRGEGVSESSDRTSAATTTRTTMTRRSSCPRTGRMLVAIVPEAARGRGAGTGKRVREGGCGAPEGALREFGGVGRGGKGRVATRGATVDRRDDGVDGTTRYKKPRCLRAATGDRCARLKTHPNVEEGGGAGGETEGGPKQSLLTNDGHTRSCVRRRERLRRLPRRTRFSHRPTRRVSEFGYCRNRATDVRPIPFIPTDFSFPKGWHSCAYRHTRARLPRVTR